MFWDSCVFIRYITADSDGDGYADICRFVEDAKRGERKIYFSTITFAEIRQEHFKPSFGSIQEFFDDLGSNFYPIEPSPNILVAAGELRSARSTNPGDPNPPNKREIGTPDAIHLMTCLYARDVLGISDIVFNTFDKGNGKGWEGRTVPIIGFERWFPEGTRTQRVKDVCGLTRKPPRHPEPMFESIVTHGRAPQPEDRA
jgi:hypothetical protein